MKKDDWLLYAVTGIILVLIKIFIEIIIRGEKCK